MIKGNSHQKLSGGQAVVELFKKRKVKNIFGLIGSATMELFDALYDNKNIKFIGVRDERTGTHMADGYARASGEAGIIIAGQNGPGATNLVTGVAQAAAAFSPVISIAGAISSEHIGKNAFQDVDQQALFEPITKKTWSVKKTREIPQTLDNAFNLALKPRCGPVHINLHRDILSKKEEFKKLDKYNSIEKPKIPIASQKDLLKTLEILKCSSNRAIIAGGGLKNNKGHKEVVNLAKAMFAPIVTSAGHGDVIPNNEELYLGQMGPRGNPIATKLIKEADVILALGTRLGFNSTFFSYENINKNAKIIQIEIEPSSLGRYFPISHGICADAKSVAKQLFQIIFSKNNLNTNKKWAKRFIEERKKFLKKRDDNAKINKQPIQPSGLFKSLRDAIPKNSIITLDAGTLCLQSTDSLNYFDPPSLFTPLDFGLVGFSFACGLGVKLARPDKNVISLMGDGGFGMTISELSTAVENNINTITIVMNNKSWGAEKAYQRDFFDKRYIGANISSPPFDKIAELYGAKGFHVKDTAEISKAIKAALKLNKPTIIEVDVDPEALYSFRRDTFKHLGN
tara:strand:+ start:177 stop:1883 length:1707 start_codon:yes stop_codon:yes gene_type:complete